MKFAIDIDNVFFDTTKVLLQELNIIYMKEFTKDDVKDYKLENLYNITEEQLLKIFQNVVNKNYLDFRLYDEYAMKLLSKIYLKQKSKVFFITKRHIELESDTYSSIDNNLEPFVEFEIIMECKSKAKENFEIYLEDNPEEIQEMIDNNKKVIIFDHPYNQDIKEKKNQIYRVKYPYWKEVEKVFKKEGVL